MSVQITITLIFIIGLIQLANASFFGLFGSSKPTRRPDVIVSESPTLETNRNAYENYLRSLVSAYYSSGKIASPVQYLPVYTYGPQLYANYIQPQQNLLYHNLIKPKILWKNDDLPKSKLESPIVVLPSYSDRKPPFIIHSGNANNLNRLIEENFLPVTKNDMFRTQDLELPEPQISATLFDLPVSGTSPDYRTGGFITKTMKTNSPQFSKTNSAQSFNLGNVSNRKTKVSGEEHVILYDNSKENHLRRGHYDYTDATGKTVVVKWETDE